MKHKNRTFPVSRGTLGVFAFFILLVFSFGSLGCFNKQERSIKNIETFTSLYGYVKYFYPGDEAAALDWEGFAIYGIKRVENARQGELKEILEELFLPAAPALVIHESSQKSEFSRAAITPPSLEGMKPVAWQYQGIALEGPKHIFKSARVNRENPGPLPDFERKPEIGEYIAKELGCGLSCIMPIALYGTEEYTYPRSPGKDLEQLHIAVKKEVSGALSGDNLYVRLADIAIAWNVFQHFYPYFDVVKTDWKASLSRALQDAYRDKTKMDFLQTLRKFTAGLKDGHSRVELKGDGSYAYMASVEMDLIEGKLTIIGVYDSKLTGIRVGDVVTEINGVKAEEAHRNLAGYIGAASRGWLRYRTAYNLLKGAKDSKIPLKIERNGKSFLFTLTRSRTIMEQYYIFLKSLLKYEKIAEGIHYLNMVVTGMDDINKLMPELVKAKAVICDFRGYPSKSCHGLIKHLLKEKVEPKWIFKPQIIYPDHEKVTYEEGGWEMEPAEPTLTAKFVFLTNARAISYAESFMGYIEGCQLGAIVGEPTAGTNGNPDPFTLPGGYQVIWTGLRVLKHDGSQLHGVGIIPHVRAAPTIEGLRAGRDEVLEKAIEIAKQ